MPDKRTGFVQSIFSEVPSTYERVNHILTFGLDIVWRRKASKIAAKAGGNRWVDLCTGTGETAVYLNGLALNGTKVFAVDFSLPMMNEARKKPGAENIAFAAADIKHLPFPDDSFDLITMSFAARNINISKDVLINSFAEYHRILKPGGRFVNLETSRPSFPPLRLGMKWYVRLFVKSVGSRISSSKKGYAYLANTIPRFYPPEELGEILRTAGFETVAYKPLLFGVAAIHLAVKELLSDR
ncbi:ubiquinone/menaquinone biosynthesis methyltransferase [Candidatus Latescibacterota bacterium]